MEERSCLGLVLHGVLDTKQGEEGMLFMENGFVNYQIYNNVFVYVHVLIIFHFNIIFDIIDSCHT